jgi:NAD(P)-dependent dehydrogenase (short-subunit alcohol dehydrogenase family)
MGENEQKAPATQIPARHLGKPSEVAKAVVYFASDESAFTVGSELVIDGGMSNL